MFYRVQLLHFAVFFPQKHNLLISVFEAYKRNVHNEGNIVENGNNNTDVIKGKTDVYKRIDESELDQIMAQVSINICT